MLNSSSRLSLSVSSGHSVEPNKNCVFFEKDKLTSNISRGLYKDDCAKTKKSITFEPMIIYFVYL